MSLVINTNVASLNAQRSLARSGRALERSFERMSSGLRINSARDDAAGLAIAGRFSAQVRSLNQAVRNANDGISLAQTAEAAMSESANILERMRELSVQSANDSNTTSDRVSIQEEVDQLIAELNRIGNDTEFNTQTLLDGTFADKDFQIGAQADQTINVTVLDSRATALGAQAKVTGTEANGGGGADGTVTDDVLNQDDGDVSLNGVFIDDTEADGVSTDGDTSSAIAKANAINKTTGSHGVTATPEATTFTSGVIQAGDLAAGGLKINDVTIGAAGGILGGDPDGKLSAAINAKSADTGVVATNNLNGTITLEAADGRNIQFEIANLASSVITQMDADIQGDFDGDENHTVTAQLTLTSDEDIVLGGVNVDFIGFTPGGAAAEDLTVQFDDVVSELTVTTKVGANSAIEVIDRAISQVAGRRGELGAVQNRLESTISNLMAVSENLSAARSRILDADFAKETAEMTRAQIVQQAGVAILAQANNAPNTVLTLLQG